ncbi:MAG: AlkA N-terminal domain-containing protein [Pseudomonadota bacterium]
MRRRTAGRPPSAGEGAGRSGDDAQRLELTLPVRGPYHAAWVFDFLDRRALPGVEEVDGLRYRRRLFDSGRVLGDLLAVWEDDHLKVSLPVSATVGLGDLLARLRRVFDLDADPEAIEAVLAEDRRLRPILAADPGLRVPGAWDGFEIAVRAILGQQVSVARARDLAVLLCERFGGGDFPAPAALVEADVSAIGMPGKRGEAVRALARAALDGTLELHEGADALALEAALVALPGIGPWTAGYVSMRVARNPDGFPDADWVVLKVLSMTAAKARKAAEAWRPWRAYAVMALWRQAGLARAAAAG